MPERKCELDSELDQEEEDDRRNEEEDEELERQERQDDEDGEDVYSDDMTASSSKLLTCIEPLMTLPRTRATRVGYRLIAQVTHHVPLHSAHARLSRPGLPHGAPARGGAAALSAQTLV